MKKITVLMMVALMAAGMCLAGNVKVLKTEYAGMDVAEEGPYVTINVKMQVSNVKKEANQKLFNTPEASTLERNLATFEQNV